MTDHSKAVGGKKAMWLQTSLTERWKKRAKAFTFFTYIPC